MKTEQQETWGRRLYVCHMNIVFAEYMRTYSTCDYWSCGVAGTIFGPEQV